MPKNTDTYRNDLKKVFLEIFKEKPLVSITAILKELHVSNSTFYYYWRKDEEFVKEYDAANEIRLQLLKDTAIENLNKLIAGFEYEEVTVEYNGNVKDKDVKRTIVTKKTVLPNIGSVIFALKNLHKQFKEQEVKEQEIHIHLEETNDNGDSGTKDKLPE